ncbi:unnamed protein product [Polarella glacialis]|uniref:Uncharacterized protein n=1 Tax=Polarella glacialis TaxID=89957 RepID=A0A813H4K9_POLGL|nr:unnamed protein product [Polarella glacialis]|mmetsp:Transcript_44225/g.80123  ORF Transcript_44225/g.80123 Transcript_44225/m.80123 type:complete len:146 (-) Transcript_44225:63-500(-)
MARQTARCLLALAAVVVVALQCSAPRSFVSSPTAVAAGAAAAATFGSLPAWAYSPEFADTQLLLARIPGGKFAKDRNLVVVSPTDDGFTDNQVAGCLVIALVGFIAAADFAKGLYFGLQPNKFKDGKTKGSVTPLAKRMIELGDA